MSISTTTRKAGPFTGNGSTVSFPFAFKVFAVDDVKVVRGEIATAAELELTRGTHYNVTLNSNQDTNPGGTVNWIGTPLSSAYTLVIGSKVASTQPATFTNLGRFYPRVINDALDRLTILVQQIAEEVSRSVKVGFSGLVSPDELVSTITTAASTATAGAASAAASAGAALDAVADAQDAIDAANAVIAGAVQADGSVAMTAELQLADVAAGALGAVPKQQAESIAAAAVSDRMRREFYASVATTSGTSKDLPVPSWAKRLTVMMAGVSGSAPGSIKLRAIVGGVEVSSGYTGTYVFNGASASVNTVTDAFCQYDLTNGSTNLHGDTVLTLAEANTWVCRGAVARHGGSAEFQQHAGSTPLSGVMTDLRVISTGGAFDNGIVVLLAEG